MADLSINYKRFDKGLNIDTDPDNMDDAELRQADNVMLPAKGGFTRRFGSKKVNATSLAAEVGQVIEWQLSNAQSKLLAMYGNNLCVINSDGTTTLKKTLAAPKIGYSTQAIDIKRGITDLMVFVDGTEFYEYGGFDWTSGAGTKTVTLDMIVKNTPVSTHATLPGIVGNFYKAKSALGSTALGAADYGDTTKWDNVTDSSGVFPDVIRAVAATYAGYDFTTANGSQTIAVGHVVKNTPVSTNASPGTVDHFYKAKVNAGYIALATADFGNTTNWEDVTGTVVVNLAPIKKCTMLLWYSTGACLLAAGNPSDAAALYKSLPGEPNNWKTDIERLYPAGGSYGPITGMVMMMRSIIVSYKTGWRHYNGTTLTGATTDVTWKTINIPVGSINNEIALTPQSITFLANDGLYRVDQSILNDDLVVVVQQEFFKNLSVDKVKAYFEAMLYRTKASLIFHDYKLYIAYCQTDYKTSDGYQKIYRGDIVYNSPVSQASANAGTVAHYYQAVADMGRINLMTATFATTAQWTDVTPVENTSTPASGASVAFNNSILVYDWEQKSFTRYRGWQVNDWCALYEGKLMFASKNYVVQANTGYNDVDVTTGSDKGVVMKVITKPYRFGNESTMHLRKYVKRMYLFAKQYLQELSGMTINVISDYVQNDLTVNLAESLIWGRVWGTKWGFTDALTQQADFKKDGTRHQIVFEDASLNNPITIYGIGFDFETLPARATTIQGGDLIGKYT